MFFLNVNILSYCYIFYLFVLYQGNLRSILLKGVITIMVLSQKKNNNHNSNFFVGSTSLALTALEADIRMVMVFHGKPCVHLLSCYSSRFCYLLLIFNWKVNNYPLSILNNC